MANCKLCGDEIGKGQYFGHMWGKHKEEAESELKQAHDAAREKKLAKSGKKASGNGHKPEANAKLAVKPKPAESLGDAVSVVISPKTFQMNSVLLWQAREAAIRFWNWPKDISPEDFLDTYLYESFKQRKILLGGIQLLDDGGKDVSH